MEASTKSGPVKAAPPAGARAAAPGAGTNDRWAEVSAALRTPFDLRRQIEAHRAGRPETFDEELRRRNLAILFWTACVFIPAYIAWTVFDFLLAPDRWVEFLTLRAIAGGINAVIVILVHRTRLRRFSHEALWVVGVIFGVFIAPMLPRVDEAAFPSYVMGFSIVLFGIGLLPLWQPRWTARALVVMLGTVVASFLVWPARGDLHGYLGSLFFVLTAAALSITVAYFKHDLAWRDFETRAALVVAIDREAEGRDQLAQATEELEAALERLKEVDRLKSKFFANISHELRTPLTLILAPLEELSQATGDFTYRQHLLVIRRNANRLLRLIDDLLDLSRLDAGGLRLNLAEVDIRAIAAAVYEASRPAAIAKGIEFVFSATPSSRRIWGDAHRLEIVLTNLVGNALKFTPDHGTIEIRVMDLERSVLVEVSDTGPGIPPEDLDRVFERFFQVTPGERRSHGGVGIGLSLAKELIELHGGTIELASTVGRGTTFSVTVPFGRSHIRPDVIERRQQAPTPDVPRRRAEDPELVLAAPTGGAAAGAVPAGESALPGTGRARIVLAEDNDEMRGFIVGLLQPTYEVMAARDGDEAWELVRRERPDLLISDVMMPGRGGTQLTLDIKSDPQLRTIPVILLTARVGSEATLEGYTHGADDFVAKPFHPRVLLARVQAQLKLRALGLQLAEREKLAVVGTLAAGILHEVRNPVNAILNAARVLGGGKADQTMAAKLIAVVADAAQRIQDITSVLETHARPAEGGESVPCDLRQGLEATVRLLEHRFERVTVHRDYRTERRAAGRAGPLNQVFLNIIDNALRAGAKNVFLRVEEAGERVVVRIANDGPPIPPDVARRIFDPFYTTREAGSGTGLGLYLSRRIVEEHHGALRLDNREGGGVEFVIELPAL
jgi:signal transduction histidine kinase